MSTRATILAALEDVAERLGDDLPRVVFVGGTVVALYGDADLDVRPTDDVDVVVAANLVEYYALVDRLKARGFRECRDAEAPVCRFVLDSGLKLDVMPTNADVLGFTNRWYAEAVNEAQLFSLPSGRAVRALTPLHFLATKLEAYRSRGRGDFVASHDLEDLVSVLGRAPELLLRLPADQSAVSSWVLEELRALAQQEGFLNAVPGCFSGDEEGTGLAAAVTAALLSL